MKSMHIGYKNFLLFWGLVFLTQHVAAEGGVYENLMIGIDPTTGVITGAYHEERNPPSGPSFSCVFAVKGNIRSAEIKAGFPGEKDITLGRLEFSADKRKTVRIKLNEMQPGCAQATPVDFKAGEQLTLSRTTPWRAVMIVTAKKAYFHNSTSQSSRRKAYVVYADSVGILEVQGQWAKVEYLNEKNSVTGWVQLQDLGAL